MFLLPYLPLLTLAQLGATTELEPFIKPLPASLTLHPLPNPFPVPNTDIALDFIAQPGIILPLPKDDVIDCFTLAKEHLEALIHEHGHGPIGYSYELTEGLVTLQIYSENAPTHFVTYSEAVAVLLGISLKMAREGYRYRRARVLQTGGGDLLGTVVVRRAIL